MQDFFLKAFDKISKFFIKIGSILDKISERIKEQTGYNIDLKMIILGIILLIFVAIFAKSILSWVKTTLYTGDY